MEQQTLTPDQMLEYAYRRNIGIAEHFLKSNPKPVYVVGKDYVFSFDKGQTYKWGGATSGGGDIFIRDSDKGKAYFTKYSHMSNI